MAKIIKFPENKAEDPSTFIQEAAGIAADNNIVSVIVALKQADGSVMTGYFKCDYGTRMEMMGHIQADIIDQMILANIGERY